VQHLLRQLLTPFAVWLVLSLGAASVWAQAADPEIPSQAVAQGVFAAARDKLLQIRTVPVHSDKPSEIGSGFLVGNDGLAITNYHVVSQFALEPETYQLYYTAADGGNRPLKVLAIDIANDLAVVRLDHGGVPFFTLDEEDATKLLAKGDRLYSMGNPLDLGLTIVEGTYNGLVDRSYIERIHFSGAINPGMSGGPTVTADGRVVGINVSKLLRGELVSFLVPARHAAVLLKRAIATEPPSSGALHAEIGRQLMVWQSTLYDKVAAQPLRTAEFGPYLAPESTAPWFNCWAQTNADQMPKPRAAVDTTGCSSDTRLFVANDLSTGLIILTHTYIRSVDLNQFQFAAFLSARSQPPPLGGGGRRWFTDQRCHEDFIAGAETHNRPPLRVIWCARAYREFEGLYDVSVMLVTEDRDREALVSRLSLQGVSYDNAVNLTQRLIEMVQWTK
jgi:S1-C subfamily serine protease